MMNSEIMKIKRERRRRRKGRGKKNRYSIGANMRT
jgi:hypothetical protein